MNEIDLEFDLGFDLELKENDERRCLDLEGVGVGVDDEYGKVELGFEVVVRGGTERRCGRCCWWWWWCKSVTVVMVEKMKRREQSDSV
jgi:hypothetical protein